MIDGITIIDTTTKFGITNLGIIIFLIAMVLIIFALAFSVNENKAAGIFGIIAFLLLIAIFAIKQIPGTPLYLRKPIIEYQVLIDDSISAKEFLKHYEVRDQIGESYIIRIKDENP